GLPRAKLSHLMDGETWMNAKKAVELGFADGLLEPPAVGLAAFGATADSLIFSRRAVTNCLLDKVRPKQPGIPADTLTQRLNLIIH
ncbi:MAG: Clp protease ClpP, partial [Oscillospiraceae bacterium]|nr:Clp protease ClpP [Oscillospiraceae bacterium]